VTSLSCDELTGSLFTDLILGKPAIVVVVVVVVIYSLT